MSNLKNISKLFSANVVAQALGVMVYPLLTRLYQPEDFGVMNLFLTVGSILTLVAVLDLHNALPLPEESKGALSLFKAGLYSLVVVVIGVVISIPFIGFFSVELVNVWWMMPIYVAVVGMWQLVSFYMNRDKQFGKIASYQVLQSSSNSLLKIVFGYLSPSGFYLVVASLLGQMIAFISVSTKKLRNIFVELKAITSTDIHFYLDKYRQFPLYAFPKNLLVQLSNGLPVMILSSAFDMKEIGYFSSALTIGFLPIQMIANSIYQVLLQTVSEKVNRKEKISGYIMKFIKYSCVGLVPAFIVLYFCLPLVTEWMFGDGWGRTGEVLRLLLPWCFATYMLSSLVFIPEVLIKLKGNLIIEIINISVRVLVIEIAIYFNNFMLAMLLIGVFTFIIRTAQLIWFVSLSKAYDDSLVVR